MSHRIVDFRSAEAFVAGHLPRAVSIPLDGADCADQQCTLRKSHGVAGLVFAYDADGAKRQQMEEPLRGVGMGNVRYVEGGYASWERAHAP